MINNCDTLQGSWKHKLQTKFKNLRRPYRAEKLGIVVPPVPKRAKVASPHASPVAVQSDSNIAEYERHISFLQRSFQSSRWSMGSVMTVLADTAQQRRHWIQERSPSVSLILEKFPCFADPRVVSA